MDFSQIHERTILKGETLSIEEISGALRGFAAIRRIDLLTTAKLLFDARKVMSKKEWKLWADEVTGLSRCEIYHRAQIGQLLDLTFANKVLYRKLITLSGDKLLALHRLAVAGGMPLLESFLAVNKVDSVSIEQLRMLVECELCHLRHGSNPDCEHCSSFGKAGTAKDDGQLTLPGFEETLDAVWQMEDDELAAKVTTDTQAVKCVSGGVKMVAAYIEHQKNKFRQNNSADMVNLLQLKAALLDGIKDIESLIAGTIDYQEEEEDLEDTQIYPAGIAGDTAAVPYGTTQTDTENGVQTAEQSAGEFNSVSGETQYGTTQNDAATGDGKLYGTTPNSDSGSHSQHRCQSGGGNCQCGDECLCGTSGECTCGGAGTVEVPPVLPGAQTAETPNAGQNDRHRSCADQN